MLASVAIPLGPIVACWLALAPPSDSANTAGTTPLPRQQRGREFERLVESQGDDPLQAFVDTQIAPAYRDTFAPGALLEHLRQLRAACAGFGGVLVEPIDVDGLRFRFLLDSGAVFVRLRLDTQPPHQIVGLELEAGASAPRRREVAPITWDNLEARLDEEAAAGFCGAVVVVRDGRPILRRGYGEADRERGLPNTAETLFAIGSVPIDFTRAAVLRLEQEGRLHTADPITRFLSDVPQDKRQVTLQHLMGGRSGLPDFHHQPGVDADYDLSWIDRDTAIRRILQAPLLFPPGEGQAHSHSAWVLLAAIVELVARQPYGEFLRDRFFVPAGMTRTGLHEDAASFDDDHFAIGYAGEAVGRSNTPKYWGRTSWLVMGSGGMYSTPMDLLRWLQAIRAGVTLSAAAAAQYWHTGVLVGGDDRGFLCMFSQGPDDLFLLCSNAHAGPGDQASALGRRLAELVRGQ